MLNNLEKLKVLTDQLIEQDEIIRRKILSTAQGLDQLRWLTGELIKKEHQISESNIMWTTFLELTENPIIISRDGEWLHLSHAWEKVTGWTVNEVKDLGLEALVHPEDYEKSKRIKERAASGHNTSRFTNRWKCKDGSFKKFHWSIGARLVELRFFVVAIATVEGPDSAF